MDDERSEDPEMFRVEHDLIGEKLIPRDRYYGIQTLRALENFSISGISISYYPELITSLAWIKKTAALSNQELDLLPKPLAEAIVKACEEIITGLWMDEFVVDMIQGGAGTSTNMNANEVIANRALEILGYEKGRYDLFIPSTMLTCHNLPMMSTRQPCDLP